MANEVTKTRKPKARAAGVIIGGLEENARMLSSGVSTEHAMSIGARISELCEELSRSVRNMEGKDDAGE